MTATVGLHYIANKLPRTIVSSKSLNYCTKKQKKTHTSWMARGGVN